MNNPFGSHLHFAVSLQELQARWRAVGARSDSADNEVGARPFPFDVEPSPHPDPYAQAYRDIDSPALSGQQACPKP